MYLSEELQSKIPLNKVLPFANVDGIGNRTSIFVQGCDLRCIYCHNPETQDRAQAERVVTVGQLLREIEPYFPYIRGVTVSGGEPTLYAPSLTLLFEELHARGLTCYIDTHGYFDREKIASLIDVTDKFLFDVKTTGETRELLGVDVKGNLENLTYLLSLDKVEEVRHVALTSLVDSAQVVREIAEILRPYPEVLLKIIKAHTRGSRNAPLIGEMIPSNKFMHTLGTLASERGVRRIKVQL